MGWKGGGWAYNVSGIRRVAVTACYNSAVHARCVRMPPVQVQVWYGMASVYIYDLDVGIEVYARLAVADILSDKFSIDICPNRYQSLFHLSS